MSAVYYWGLMQIWSQLEGNEMTGRKTGGGQRALFGSTLGNEVGGSWRGGVGSAQSRAGAVVGDGTVSGRWGGRHG